MALLRLLIVLALLLVLAVGVLAYVGWYDVAADKPHPDAVTWFAEQVRDRSVEVRARGVQVPRLDDETMVRDGAGHYAEMCAGCHMAPGETDTSFPDALYPHPPRLTQPNDLSQAEQFWVIKHGIKLSAMPAWGATHNDQSIWNIVAFLQRLPTLNAEQYKALLPAGAAEGHHHDAAGAPVQEPSPGGVEPPADAPPKDEAAPDAKPAEKPKPNPDDPDQHETRP